MWRIRHYRVVARVIGDSVVGTQGTPVEVLGRLVADRRLPGALGRPERADGAVEGRREPPRRGHGAPAGAPPPRHGQSRPGTRPERAEVLRDYLARNGVDVRARRRRRPSAPTSSRGSQGGDGPIARCSSPTPTRSRRPGRVGARPLVGRPRRRRGLGARRARHEGPGRRRRRRVRLARAGGLHGPPATSCSP